MNYDPNRPGGYPPLPHAYPPPAYPQPGGYGGPYAPPPRKGRGWLIALIVLVVVMAGGAGAYFTGALDPLLKKIGIQMPIWDENGDYTARGLSQARGVIGGKRWAEPGKCATNWTDFRSDGTASSHDGTNGTWEITRDQKLLLTDGASGRTATLDAGAHNLDGDPIGTFSVTPPGGQAVGLEYCGPA